MTMRRPPDSLADVAAQPGQAAAVRIIGVQHIQHLRQPVRRIGQSGKGQSQPAQILRQQRRAVYRFAQSAWP